MAEPDHPRVRIGRGASGVIVQPVGACTAVMCDAIRMFVDRLCPADAEDLLIDLSRADSLDSTFAGMLLAMARPTADADLTARLHLLNPSSPACEALRRMRVLGLFDVRQDGSADATEWTELPRDVSPESVERLRALIIDAHERLIAADPRNADVFRPVVDTFRRNRPTAP
ncbi:MAG: hypothetical protein HUU22_06915 [Phycisphaerae bacterium]|nr:hypothetical protein [Phycisphaerae bacterium]NUQ45746.1 hypothetical protein [Phycisphaerae bacterium]